MPVNTLLTNEHIKYNVFVDTALGLLEASQAQTATEAFPMRRPTPEQAERRARIDRLKEELRQPGLKVAFWHDSRGRLHTMSKRKGR